MNTPTFPSYWLVFDVESVGLHGDGFAVGYVLLDIEGRRECASGLAWCDPSLVAQGAVEDRAWVAANIPALPESCREPNARAVRDYFWRSWKDQPGTTWLVADCPWPVEARFLLSCIADDPIARAWSGPYPLIDVASVRLAAGLAPLGTEERHASELPMHNPLADARQSARLLLEALRMCEHGLAATDASTVRRDPGKAAGGGA